MKTWQVFKGNKFIGITESNYAYASKWWADYTSCTKRNPSKAKYKLKEVTL